MGVGGGGGAAVRGFGFATTPLSALQALLFGTTEPIGKVSMHQSILLRQPLTYI